jgi:hypothetical protein
MKKTERHIFKSDKNRDSFQKWSAHRINQVTAATSLMFAIASAALGYMMSQLIDTRVPIQNIATWPFAIGIVAFTVSTISGIVVVFNRLDSFRETCEIIKQRDDQHDAASLEEKRRENEETDAWTTTAFKVQFWSFAAGALCLFVHAFTSNLDRVRLFLDRLS